LRYGISAPYYLSNIQIFIKMKKLFCLLFISLNLNSTTLLGQNSLEIPPGTIFLNESLFIDKVPVTNLMFLEYLTAKDFIRKKGFDSFSEFHKSTDQKFNRLTFLYPSFLKNLNKKGSFLSKKNYFENYRYKNSPVLNVSKEQALDYCKWRTEMVQYSWSNNTEQINYKINYRLPKEDELSLAKEHFKKLNKFQFHADKNPTKFKTQNEENDFVLYNISEYTLKENLFWQNWKNITPTEFPNETTGFRCVCEILP